MFQWLAGKVQPYLRVVDVDALAESLSSNTTLVEEVAEKTDIEQKLFERVVENISAKEVAECLRDDGLEALSTALIECGIADQVRVSAEDVAEHIDVSDVAANVDHAAIAENLEIEWSDHIDYDAVANAVDMSDLASKIDTSDLEFDYEELASNIDVDDLSGRISMRDLAREVDLGEIAGELDHDDIATKVLENLDLSEHLKLSDLREAIDYKKLAKAILEEMALKTSETNKEAV